jgi:hypothetical protein
MFVQIKLSDPKAAFSDNGIAICGGDPMIVELSPFICGLIYRGEAEIYESTYDKAMSKKESQLETLPWYELKKMAVDLNLDISRHPSKSDLIALIKGANDVVQHE